MKHNRTHEHDTRESAHLWALLLLFLCLFFAKDARGESPPQPLVASQIAPPVHKVRQVALRQHNTLADINRLRRRARLANLLPEIQLRSTWRRQQDQEDDYREDHSFDDLGFALQDSARYDMKTGNIKQNTYSVSLTFNLPGLIFDRTEIDLSRFQTQHQESRDAISKRVNTLYFKRAEQLERLRTLELDEEEIITHTTNILFYNAELDAITGGWFSAQLEGHHE